MTPQDEFRKLVQETTRPADKRKQTVGRLETDGITTLLRELGRRDVLKSAWEEAKQRQKKHYLSCSILQSVWEDCPFYIRSHIQDGKVVSCPPSINAYLSDWTGLPMVKVFKQIQEEGYQQGIGVSVLLIHLSRVKAPMILRQGAIGPVKGARIVFGDSDMLYVIESVSQFAALVRQVLE